MTTQTKLNSTIFPDFPRGSPAVTHDGNFSPLWHLQLSSLFQALQKNFGNEGIQIPQLNSEDINTIEALYNPILIGKPLPTGLKDISGKIVFDSANKIPKIFIITYNGNNIATASWKTFTLT